MSMVPLSWGAPYVSPGDVLRLIFYEYPFCFRFGSSLDHRSAKELKRRFTFCFSNLTSSEFGTTDTDLGVRSREGCPSQNLEAKCMS